MPQHDEIYSYIRSFHSSPARAFVGTDEGQFFLGRLIAFSFLLFYRVKI